MRIFLVILSILLILNTAMTANRGTQQELAGLLTLLDILKSGQNAIFTKFGDGEYLCMAGSSGANCDGDRYHSWLGHELQKAFISLSKKQNTFIGRWWEGDGETTAYCDKLAHSHQVTVPWVCYSLIMNGDEFLLYDYMHEFAEFIISTSRKKILVCNHKNRRLKDFFRADVFVEIPSQSWSYDYTTWKKRIESHLEKDCILLIAAGMCSKVLINDLTNNHTITCLDIGSSFDILGSKCNSRYRNHTYQDEVNYYRDLLPENWDREEL